MKTLLLVISFLFLVSSGFATNVEGTWKSKENSSITFVFQTNGDNLSGTVKDAYGNRAIPATKISNNKFTFSLAVPEYDSLVKYVCTINEDGTINVKVTDPKNETTILLQKQ